MILLNYQINLNIEFFSMIKMASSKESHKKLSVQSQQMQS